MKHSRIKSSGYTAKGDMALTPMELQDIRMRLLSTNKLEDLRLLTMILLSIKLFLRSDEIINMKIEDVVEDVTIVKDSFIEALALRVQGKSDSSPVILSLWADDIIPEFCPVRHLLVYLHLSGISQGYLFPGHIDGHIAYDQYHAQFINICKQVLPRSGPFGTHSCRKTAYLFAVWGGGSESDIMESARHKAISQALKYKRDALYLLRLAEANGTNFTSIIGNWKPIYCADLQMGCSINSFGSLHYKDLESHANYFITKLCGVEQPKRIGTLRSLQAAINYKKPASAIQEIMIQLRAHLSSDVAVKLMQLIDKCILQNRMQFINPGDSQHEHSSLDISDDTFHDVNPFPDQLNSSSISTCSQNVSDNVNSLHCPWNEDGNLQGGITTDLEVSDTCINNGLYVSESNEDNSSVSRQINDRKAMLQEERTSKSCEQPEVCEIRKRKNCEQILPKKRARGGTIEIAGRKNLTKQNNHQKLESIILMHSQLPLNRSEMTEGCRNFAITTLDPVFACLQKHYNGDHDGFLGAWRKFNHSKFGKTCCDGKSIVCNASLLSKQ
jgi:hypothetical protein